MGKDIKFTDGKISSKTGYEGDVTTYQTTTPIQPGNSGGLYLITKEILLELILLKLFQKMLKMLLTMEITLPFDFE